MDKQAPFPQHPDACACADEHTPHDLGNIEGGAPTVASLMALNSRPCFTLAEILPMLSDEELMLAIELYDMDEEEDLELESLSRAELIARATKALTDPAIHEANLLSLPYNSREHYLWLKEEGEYRHPLDQAEIYLQRLMVTEDDEEATRIIEFMERETTMEALASEMLVFPFVYEGMLSYVMPHEVRDACDKIATEEFLEYAENLELASEYIDAATNLYGAVAIEDIIDIMAAYEPNIDATTAAELIVESIEVNKLWPHSVENGFVAHPLFNESIGLGVQMAFDLLKTASKTPRYQPEPPIFLNYAFHDFEEENFEADLLYELLVDLYPEHDKDDCYEMVQFVQQCARQGMRSEIIVEAMFKEILPGPLANEAQSSLLIKQLAKLMHTTRTWTLNGRSPAEVEEI